MGCLCPRGNTSGQSSNYQYTGSPTQPLTSGSSVHGQGHYKANSTTTTAYDATGKSTYYHHTDTNSARLILKSGTIKQSTDTQKDAIYGEGTYVTKLGPDVPKSKVAENNYDDGVTFWENQKKMGKTDVVIEVKTTAVKCPGDRDVYKHVGNIPWNDIQKVHVRDDEGGWIEIDPDDPNIEHYLS